jgi:hypothetical protein
MLGMSRPLSLLNIPDPIQVYLDHVFVRHARTLLWDSMASDVGYCFSDAARAVCGLRFHKRDGSTDLSREGAIALRSEATIDVREKAEYVRSVGVQTVQHMPPMA